MASRFGIFPGANRPRESAPSAEGAATRLDTPFRAIHLYYMPIATLRLTTAEKRRFTAEARRRGLTLSEYLRQAGQTEANRVDWKTFFAAMPATPLPPHAPADLSAREGFGG